MPTTPEFDWPTPAAEDPSDAPNQLLALAQAIEEVVKRAAFLEDSGVTIQLNIGHLILGDPASGKAYFNGVTRGPTANHNIPARWYLSARDMGTPHGHAGALTLAHNGVELAQARFRADGQVFMSGNMNTDSAARPLPFAMATGTVTLAIGVGQSAASTTVSLPLRRFRKAPIVTAVANRDDYIVGVANGATELGFVVNVRHGDNAGASTARNIIVRWHAVQMLAETAEG